VNLMSKHSNKVVIVTGASKGIGAGIAERLARDGASVVVNYARSKAQAAAVVDRITQAGGKAVAIQADISEPGDIQPLIDATLQHFGRLDFLVNNAGLYKLDSLSTITSASIAEHYDLNVRGLALMTQAAARVLPAGGVVVNISSGVATSPSPMAHIYCSTKAAVDSLTRTFGTELGPKGIRVVGIAPGYTATDGNADAAEANAAYFVPKTPLGRVGLPKDIAAVTSFALSEDASWLTACTIDAAGGMVF
jgi:3-oxoacyl-[acyl-carrier protein] reductase